MSWQIFAVLATILYALINFFIKLGSGGANGKIAALVMNFTAVSILLTIILATRTPIKFTGNTAWWILGAGAAAALGNIFAFKMFNLGAPLTITAPMFAIGAVIIGYVLGLIVFKEPFKYTQIVGVLLGIAAIYLLFR